MTAPAASVVVSPTFGTRAAAAITCGSLLLVAAAPEASAAVMFAGMHLVLCGWLAVIDARTHRLPNRLVMLALACSWAALAALAVRSNELQPLVGGAVGMLAYSAALLAARKLTAGSVGMGDVKFAAVLGTALGSLSPGLVVIALSLAWLIQTAASAVVCVRRRSWRACLPFGPALVAAQALLLVAAA